MDVGGNPDWSALAGDKKYVFGDSVWLANLQGSQYSLAFCIIDTAGFDCDNNPNATIVA